MSNIKLELKHLVPYLPYKLKARFKEKNSRTCRKYVVGQLVEYIQIVQLYATIQ